jgi:hypothetical protein
MIAGQPALFDGPARSHSLAARTPAGTQNPWRLQAWMGHKRIDETMIYVHVAEDHRRDTPDRVLAAAAGETGPDRRILLMLGSRGSNVAVNSAPTDQSRTIQAT